MRTLILLCVTLITATAGFSSDSDLVQDEPYSGGFWLSHLYRRLLNNQIQPAKVTVEQDKVDDRPWIFAVHLWNDEPFERINKNGQFEGFFVDLINGVCEHANKHCEIMYADVKKCYHQVEGQRPVAGEGIMGRWFDGCVGYLKSAERRALFDFSDKMADYQFSKGAFYVKKGNPHRVDPTDLADTKIGFIESHVFDDTCLGHSDTVQGIDVAPTENKVYYPDRQQLLRGLEKGEVNVIFVSPQEIKPTDVTVVKIGPRVKCSDSDITIITLKGSPLRQWFNKALGEMMESGEYYKICYENERKRTDYTFGCVE